MKIGQASDFQLQTLAPQKISRSTRIKFVARSLLISGRGKSSLAPRILIIRPPKYVPLGSLAFYILRGTCYISTREEGYRWQCLWRADVTKCTEAPRRLPNCVAIAETSHSSWRCTLHGILPALPFFFPGKGRGGGVYCISSSRSRGFERLADISDGVQSLPAAFAVEAWIIKKKGRGIEGIFREGILNFKDWKGSVF